MIVVTGGAGFIGSNIVSALNARGRTDILVVDDLTEGHKFSNLTQCDIQDYMDKDDFLEIMGMDADFSEDIDVIFHQGACSDTTEWDGQMMMRNNYEYSKALLHVCLDNHIPFIYASSAAVYGGGQIFKEGRENEKPLNVYGYSKYLFDEYVRRVVGEKASQVVGLRYFNVYGPNEAHKGSMASVAFHLRKQLQQGNVIKLFGACDGYEKGEQRRDFIYVEDVVKLNLWFWDNPRHSGIFNAGTGQSQTFNDVAHAIIQWHERGELHYIPFPDHLKGHYQSFTEADLSALRAIGYDGAFMNVEQGINAYMDRLTRDE